MQQSSPNNPNLTNPAVEVALIVLAGVLILLGAGLLYLGKIDIGFASFIFMTALTLLGSLLGLNLAYKVPSPAQQAQLGTNQQNLQQALHQALSLLPVFANVLQSHANLLASQQSQAPRPVQNVPVAPVQSQITAPQPQVGTLTATAPVQFKSSLPDISMPMNVVSPPTPQQAQP